MASEPPQSLKVLFVCSTPLDPSSAPLDWRKEWQHITQNLCDKNLPLNIVRLIPPTWGALQKTLAEGDFAVVHFSGHGNRHELLLEDEYGQRDPVKAADLADLFKRTKVSLVVLNACHSGEGAESPAQALHDLEVPSVIATTGPIFDDEALLLTDHLYSGLASGRRVSEALEMARSAIAREAQRKRRDPAKRADILTSFLHCDEAVFKPQRGVEAEVTVIDGLPLLRNIEHPYSFFGRYEELTRLSELLSDTSVRSVNITGLGGIGKSSLTEEAALRNSHRFGALIKANARGVPDFSLTHVFNAIDEVLQLRLGAIADEGEKAARAAQGLNSNHSLLVLDNLETLAEAEQRRIADFLKRLDPLTRSKALLTMRPHIEVFEELDGAANVPLHGLDLEASCLLIEDEARHKTPPIAYLIGEYNRSNQEALAEAAFFHPFLMKTAVGRLTRTDLDSTLEDLKNLKGPFEEKCQEWLDGQLALLEEDGQRLLPRLSVFVGSADKKAIDAVCGEGISVGQALDEAWQASLVDYEPNLRRYSLHQIVLDYVTTKGALPQEEHQTLQAAHAQVFLDMAKILNTSMRSEYQVPASGLFRLEWGNMRAGFEWARANENGEMTADYGIAVGEMLDLVGLWAEAELIQEIALQAAVEMGDRQRQAVLTGNLGIMKQNLGKMDEALEAYKGSLRIFKQLGNRGSIANILSQVGMVHHDQGRYGMAMKVYNKSLKIREKLGDRQGIATSLHQMGMIHQDQGRYDDAQEAYQQSLKIKEPLGDRRSIAATLHQMGTLHQHQGRYDEAQEAYQQSLKIKEPLGSRRGIAATLHQMGMLHQHQGRDEEALEAYQQSLETFKQLGDRRNIAATLHQVGTLHQHQGRYGEALEAYQQSMEIKEPLGDRHGISITLAQLALLHEKQGELAEALEHIRQAEEIFRELGSPHATQAKGDRERIEAALADKENR
ncbi:MAG: tetratricopeptide repeat protein [bacterium]|nr:tetratricopeptide repeat protein [bacterium]